EPPHRHHPPQPYIARRVNVPQAVGIAGDPKSAACSAPSRLRKEGRIAIVTNVGSGMRWTPHVIRRMTLRADGKAVWSWRPLAGVKLATMVRVAPMTVTKKSRTPGRARNKP